MVDKRKVRRDLADFFSTHAEGVKGRRALEWRFVDQLVPKSKFQQVVAERAKALAAKSDRPSSGKGIVLTPLNEKVSDSEVAYQFVSLKFRPAQRLAELTVRGPSKDAPRNRDALVEEGADAWGIRAFRELDDALLRLRINHLEIGTVLLKTEGDPKRVLQWDAWVAAEIGRASCRERV